MNRAKPILITALLAAIAFASPSAATSKSLYAAPADKPSVAAEGEPEVVPAPPPSPAMQDKFRKLQKEMQTEPKPLPGTASEAMEEAPHGNVKVGSLALQILFGLAFVLLLAVVSIRGLKRMQGKLLSRPGKGGDILEVLETCHLGPQQKVIAIRMNDEVGIIGVTKEGISMLTVLKEPADDLRRARATESNSAAFSDNLNKLLDRFKKPKKVSDLLDEEQG